jgi:anti-anti-sigma regulatory factor
MGLRLLVSVSRSLDSKGKPLVFYGLQPEVLEIFEDSGMSQLLTLATDLSDAEQKLGA